MGAGLAILAVLVLRFSFSITEHQYGDNCGYLTLGMAFANGLGFSDPSIPSHPHFLWWPPGFPLAIALFYKVFGPQWVLLKLLILILLYCSFFLFAALLLKRSIAFADTAAIIIVVSISSAIHSLSSYLYAETFFTALTLLFFWLFHYWANRLSYAKIVLLSICALYISTIRNIGMALPLALIAYFGMRLKNGHDRPARRWAVLPLLLIGCYAAVVLTVPELKVGSFQEFFGLHPAFQSPVAHVGEIGRVAPGPLSLFYHRAGSWIAKTPNSLRGYGLTLIPQALIQSAYALHSMTRLKAVLMAAVTLVVLCGWIASWKRFPIINLYAFFYMAILMAYGPLYVRLLTPLAPFLILYLYTGLKTGVMAAADVFGKRQFAAGKAPGVARVRRIFIALLAVAWALVAFDNAWWTFTTPRRYMPPQFGDQAYQNCLSWVTTHARADEVVVCDVYSWLFLLRGGQNVPYHFTAVESNMVTFLDFFKVKYLLAPPYHGTGFRYLDTVRNLARRDPGAFRVVFGGDIDSSCVIEYRR
jgi:hypothetical protein